MNQGALYGIIAVAIVFMIIWLIIAVKSKREVKTIQNVSYPKEESSGEGFGEQRGGGGRGDGEQRGGGGGDGGREYGEPELTPIRHQPNPGEYPTTSTREPEVKVERSNVQRDRLPNQPVQSNEQDDLYNRRRIEQSQPEPKGEQQDNEDDWADFS